MPRKPKSEDQLYIRQDISMEPGQHRQLMEYCQREERSMSYVIRRALEEYFMCNATQ